MENSFQSVTKINYSPVLNNSSGGIKDPMGKNPKLNSSTDCNKAELMGKIPKINSSTGVLLHK